MKVITTDAKPTSNLALYGVRTEKGDLVRTTDDKPWYSDSKPIAKQVRDALGNINNMPLFVTYGPDHHRG